MGSFVDFTGAMFGNWKVIKFVGVREVGKAKVKKAFWLCECQCEKKTLREIPSDSLKSGNSKSCGCLKIKATIERSTKHGFARRGKNGSSIYHVWHEIKDRCLNTNNKQYGNYGGRGITICDEWKASFVSFKDWAFSNGYKTGLTIDRINNDGNYEPSNCRWVDYKVQANNTRSNVFIEYSGERKTIAQWCEQLGQKPQIVYNRIDNYGWNPVDALIMPKQKNIPVICFTENGYEREFSCVAEAARELDVSQAAIRNACRRNHRCAGFYWKPKYKTRTR